MGAFKKKILVGGREEHIERTQEVEVLVDTGAHHSALPASLLHSLNVSQAWIEDFELADGAVRRYPVGYAMFYIGDKERECPVVFASDDAFLLGATTLENFSFGVDPVGQDLIPLPPRARPF